MLMMNDKCNSNTNLEHEQKKEIHSFVKFAIAINKLKVGQYR